MTHLKEVVNTWLGIAQRPTEACDLLWLLYSLSLVSADSMCSTTIRRCRKASRPGLLQCVEFIIWDYLLSGDRSTFQRREDEECMLLRPHR